MRGHQNDDHDGKEGGFMHPLGRRRGKPGSLGRTSTSGSPPGPLPPTGVATAAALSSIYVSPWGGPGGASWMYHFPGGAVIKHIEIGCGVLVDSLRFTTSDGIVSPRFGGGGGELVSITINSPLQRLTGISGTYGHVGPMFLLTSLRFHTNRGDYGPYGRVNGDPFSMKMEDGIIVGFHGSAGNFLDAIGVYVQSTN